MLILRLALRAIRWRAAASATVFAVAVVAIFAATTGPIYLHAVDQAVLARHLTDASLSQRDVLVTRTTERGYPHTDWAAQVRGVAGQLGPGRLFARPLTEEQVDVVSGKRKIELASADHQCAHLEILRGRCPTGSSTDQTAISARTAADRHLTVGSTVTVGTVTLPIPIRLRVVGIYNPIAPHGAFWAPWDLFEFGQPASVNQPPPGDAALVTPAALSSRRQRLLETLSADVALRPGAVGYDDIDPLRAMVAHANATVTHLAGLSNTNGLPATSLTTSLPTILDQTADETSLSRTLVTVATAQLALLAIFLLYAVVANTTAVQGPEVALAKLRGRRTASVLAQSIAQPVILIVAATPVAAALAWVVVRLLADRLLGGPVAVVFPPAAYGVAALGLLGGLLAAVVAARRIVVTPVGALMRSGTTQGSPAGLLIADAAAVTIAVAGLIELKLGGVLDSGNPNPLSVLAPTLLAVAAAVVVLRLLPFLARRVARWTRDSHRLATFLAVRQLLRRPAEARAVLLVAVAVSIATFAVSTWATSRHNRSLRALNSAGADTVLVVRPGAGVEDLRTAVDRADPSGQSMAVASTHGDEIPRLVAVDTARFRSVGAWTAANAPSTLPSVLHRLGGRVAPVTVTGRRLRLRVDLIRHPPQRVRLTMTVAGPDHRQEDVAVAPIGPGTRSYPLSLPPSCVAGCRITALGLTADTPDYFSRSSEIDAVIGASARSGTGWRPVAAFGDRDRWRADGKGAEAIGTAGAALSLDLHQSSGSAGWPSALSAAIPRVIPAVLGSAQAALYRGNQIHDVEAVGLDGQALSVDGAIRAVTLPEVDRGGIMVDYGTALAAMTDPSSPDTQYQVWLSPRAPSDMPARLARQHVVVQRVIDASRYRPALDDSGPAFADKLFLLSALAAAVLAIAATAAGRVLSVRRRAYELAALETVGVAPRTLRRATAAEQAGVFAIGLLVGLAAGLAGSALALPSTPVFVDTATGPALVLGLPWGLLAAFTAATVVVFVAVSVAVARAVERVATPSQLRGAQQ